MKKRTIISIEDQTTVLCSIKEKLEDLLNEEQEIFNIRNGCIFEIEKITNDLTTAISIWQNFNMRIELKKIATCKICGCNDEHACVNLNEQPCHWVEVDYQKGTGICSYCANKYKTDR